jgi:uncharacterized membrane protein (UPF0127 family)
MRRRFFSLLLLLCLPFSAQAAARMADVTFQTQAGPQRFTAEVVDTPDAREHGLMYRTTLPERHGMLFLFPETAMQAFWMKNTLIPLDMIFIDDQGVVTNIAENAVPETLDVHRSTRPVRTVLELAGGSAARYHLRAGDRVAVEELGTDVKSQKIKG